jgi:hypothetical protein
MAGGGRHGVSAGRHTRSRLGCGRGSGHLPALHLVLTEPAAGQRRRRTCRGIDLRQASPGDVIGYLRDRQITLTYDPASGTLDTGAAAAAQTITLTAR